MTRNRNYCLSVFVPFIVILALSITAALLAQTSGAGPTTGRTNSMLAPAAASMSAQAERSLTPWTDGGSPLGRSHRKRHGARPMDGDQPLFLPAVAYGTSGGPEKMAVADVDGDGIPDLLVATDAGYVDVLIGNGDGTFQPKVSYASGGIDANSVAVGDVNGDGKPDLVVANKCVDEGCGSGTVGVLLGNGDGTFQPVVVYNSGGQGAYDLAIADLNGKGKPDVVVVNNFSSSLSVLLNSGDGTFAPAVNYGTGWSNPISVVVSDVNLDGRPDVVVANWCDSYGCSVGVLLGNGDGTFQAAVTYSAGGLNTMTVAVADVNGDGKPDLLTANADGGPNGYGSLAVLLGNGDGTFQPPIIIDPGKGGASALAVADVSGDGKPDAVTGGISLFFGTGDGSFDLVATYIDLGIGSLLLADLNGDGWPDMLASNHPLSYVDVFLNNMGPHSATTTTLISSPNPSVYGQAAKLTAAVAAASGPTPSGTVIFYSGSTQLGSATLSKGSTSITLSSLTAGSYSITAAYQGDPDSNPSTSNPLNQIVAVAATTTSLTSSRNPAKLRQRVTYTAAVTSQYGAAATGTVTLQDGGITFATVTLSGNEAAYTTSYGSDGIHSITATYSGDANNTGSMSGALTEAIGSPFATETALATSGSPSQLGQPVTFTATVTSKYATIPNGELVTFYNGKTEIGTGTTASGVANFTTSSLTAKTHTIKATYAGDALFKPSRGTVRQVVGK
jgi:hypothetical protein